VLQALGQLDAYPEAAEAFDLLDRAGLPAVTLTNGGRQHTEKLLESAGFRQRVQHVLTKLCSSDLVPLLDHRRTGGAASSSNRGANAPMASLCVILSRVSADCHSLISTALSGSSTTT
jgi:hypothetical protein